MRKPARSPRQSAVTSAAAALSLIAAAADARACAVCFGAPGSDLAESMSLSILFMIGVIAVMLTGLGVFIYTLHRRARAAGARPPVDEFGADILPGPPASQR